MWNNLPFELLSKIFSLLSPDSLARAMSSCQRWHTCAKTYPLTLHSNSNSSLSSKWFIALPCNNRVRSCYVHNPILNSWHTLSLDFLPISFRVVTSIDGNILLSSSMNSSNLQLIVCNPFIRQCRYLPLLNVPRINPTLGVVIENQSQNVSYPPFRVYVVGGMSMSSYRGSTYESTLEMYDSRHDTWQIVGSVPMEFAIRLTVWTPNDSVYCDGVVYWITSARAYSVMGLEVESNTWREFSVPLAEKLDFAALAIRNGMLTLVGGTLVEDVCVWGLIEKESGNWGLIEKVPIELGMRLLSGERSWCNTKCVSFEGSICLYRELGSGMIICREMEDVDDNIRKWKWVWVEGCCFVKGKQVANFPIKGLLFQPTLSPPSKLTN